MIITAQLFEDYLKCATKCWLRSKGEKGSGNSYAEWLQRQQDAYRNAGAKRLTDFFHETVSTFSHFDSGARDTTRWHLDLDFLAQTETSESRIHAVESITAQVGGKPAKFSITRFVFRNRVTKDDRLILAFDVLVLSEMLRRKVEGGQIIHGKDPAKIKVNMRAFAHDVRRIMRKVAALLSNSSPPELFLNRHCSECGFQAQCRASAFEKDDLSLLGGITETECRKYHMKGIFTVTQLSHTFRARRRPRRQSSRFEKYHHSLKARAIREGKIHIVGNPTFKIKGTPVFLDVEGIPDRNLYYLIGMRIRLPDTCVQLSYWADTANDEQKIWNEFRSALGELENPVLLYYGSYETTFLRRMSARYESTNDTSAMVQNFIENAVNLLSFLYARVYFPTYSNGLKDIAGFLGYKWSDPSASGVKALQWRSQWELQECTDSKEQLIRYNAEDCEAAEKVAVALSRICSDTTPDPNRSVCAEVVRADDVRDDRFWPFRNVEFAIPGLDQINKAAYWIYQREKVLVKSSKNLCKAKKQKHVLELNKPRINKTVVLSKPERCTKCGHVNLNTHAYRSRVIYDLKLANASVKRWVLRYQCVRSRCPACKTVFDPCHNSLAGNKYGRTIIAFSIFQTIEMRLSAGMLCSFLKEVLGIHLSRTMVGSFRASVAAYYESTYQKLIRDITHGTLVHADETKISIKGGSHFVWVFTNLQQIVYIYSDTREGELVHSYLNDFKGVLISDFYTVYDTVDCPQQRCLIHLIRDLNDDLLKEPFNEEMKTLGGDFTNVLKPIIETIDRFGLKSRYLKKHKQPVKRFFASIKYGNYETEIASKWQKRFEKNQGKLFTFLDHDGIPWNNNNAEHAIKSVALLRNVIGGSSTPEGIHNYLVLLSISETCKCNNLSFLDFLLSRETDIEVYAASKTFRHRYY